MKRRNYSFLLVLISCIFSVQLFAQTPDSISVLDSMINQARHNVEEKSQELRELQRKKTDLYRQKSAEKREKMSLDNRNSAMFYAGRDRGAFLTDIGSHVSKVVDKVKNFSLDYVDRVESGNYSQSQKVEKTKTISKSYPVSKDDKLRINNKYGKVVINIWAKNEIKVDVEIKAYSNDDRSAQETLDRVHINESKQGNIVSFETVFEESNSRFKYNERREVNYTVYMPAGNPLDLKNGYGNTTIASDFNGPVTLSQSYGNLTTSDLNNPSNTISVRYGKATIGNLKSGSIDMSYGNLSLAEAGKLDARLNYAPARIDRISGDVDLDLKYAGELRIGKIAQSVKKVDINASYSSMSLGFDPSANFNFDVTGNNLSFNYDDSKVTLESGNNSFRDRAKNYSGKYGKGSDSRIVIRSNYSSVKFL